MLTEEEQNRLVDSFIEIEFINKNDFLKIKETLTRIGIAGKANETEAEKRCLYQSCHILHKRQRYYLVHFKELFALDGKKTDFSPEDRARRNTIADLLEQWGLLRILNPDQLDELTTLSNIRILNHKEKADWILQPKYNLGKKK